MDDALTQEQYELLLALGSENSELDPQIAQQLELAKQLRAQGQVPEGRMAGRVFVAPNALEYLGALANTRAAGVRGDSAAELQKKRAQNAAAQNAMVMRGILSPQQPTPQPAAVDPYAAFRTGGGA